MGVSYDEIYAQAYGSPGVMKDFPVEPLDSSHLSAHLQQFDALMALIAADTSENSIKALAKHRFIIFTLNLKHAAKAFSKFARDPDPMRQPTSMDWHDSMMLAWEKIITSCSQYGIDGPAREAVAGDLIFLLEEWSIGALSTQVYKITQIVSDLDTLLNTRFGADERYLSKLFNQVYYVHRRLANRQGLQPWVVQEWNEAFNAISPRLL
ncbi:hypothetical protein DL93DRAFT_1700747 [Clavulina sp. PMI_390]|nr:hypothetical protein DL93DRAFT_1700747 [Clavulina sp. PMI_390]